ISPGTSGDLKGTIPNRHRGRKVVRKEEFFRSGKLPRSGLLEQIHAADLAPRRLMIALGWTASRSVLTRLAIKDCEARLRATRSA
ncbi:MAG: hypothetical protein ABFD75_16140, partial [Smithella sp.]